MGADVINMNIEGSSLRKGESLHDTAQTLGAMNPDLVVIRHGIDNASEQINAEKQKALNTKRKKMGSDPLDLLLASIKTSY